MNRGPNYKDNWTFDSDMLHMLPSSSSPSNFSYNYGKPKYYCSGKVRMSLCTKQLRIMVTDLERPLAFIKQHFQLIYQLKNHIMPIQNQTNCHKPSKKPKLLVGKINILKHPIFKVLPSQHCLIKDIWLR